jgi:hypothetical protein
LGFLRPSAGGWRTAHRVAVWTNATIAALNKHTGGRLEDLLDERMVAGPRTTLNKASLPP